MWCVYTHIRSRLITSTPSFRPRCWLPAFGLQSGSAFLCMPECERTHARLLLLGLLWRLSPHAWSKQRHVILQPEPDCHHTWPTEAHTLTVPCVSQQCTHRCTWHEGQNCRRPVKGCKHAHTHQGPCPRYSDIQQTLLQLHGSHQRCYFSLWHTHTQI